MSTAVSTDEAERGPIVCPPHITPPKKLGSKSFCKIWTMWVLLQRISRQNKQNTSIQVQSGKARRDTALAAARKKANRCQE